MFKKTFCTIVFLLLLTAVSAIAAKIIVVKSEIFGVVRRRF